MRAQGLTSRQIAQRIGIEIKTVSALEGSAARVNREPKRDLPSWNSVAIDMDTLRALRPHAARRGVSVTQLARELLHVLADDDLVDALLDDETQRS